MTNLPFAVLVAGAFFAEGRLAEVGAVVIFLMGLRLMMADGCKRMFLPPGSAVIGPKRLYLIVLQIDIFFSVGNAAFGDVGAELTAEHAVQFAGSQVGIVLQHGVDELIHAVQTFLL